MFTLVFCLVVFLVISIVFLFIHLMMGKFIRPSNPEPDKLTIYECGEPTVGSAWIQFDLRYYVVALLFVIFDVEVAFFFPWAITFGKANDLARADLPEKDRAKITAAMIPSKDAGKVNALPSPDKNGEPAYAPLEPIEAGTAEDLSRMALVDIVVFFGVLLVGFAYLWKRGDIDWVKTVAAEQAAEPPEAPPMLPKPRPAGTLVGAGHR